MKPSRRGLLGLLAAGAALAAPRVEAAPAKLDVAKLSKDTDVACLYHCDFGEPQRFSQMLQNMNNHLSAYDFDPMRLKLVIVAHGAGIKFFLNDLTGSPWEKERIDPDLYKRFVGLSKYGVEAYLCQITYQRLKLDAAKTHSGEHLRFVPSGVATVGELQSKGFGYLKVG
jgi:intracellular sulfur oxidation DsrE/DsrF family protein